MANQQLLSPLESLSQKLQPYSAQVVVGFPRKCIAEVLLESNTAIDQVCTEMIQQLDRHLFYPREFSHCVPHVASHEECEVRGAPIGWQPKLDANFIPGLNLHRIIHEKVKTGLKFATE